MVSTSYLVRHSIGKDERVHSQFDVGLQILRRAQEGLEEAPGSLRLYGLVLWDGIGGLR